MQSFQTTGEKCRNCHPRRFGLDSLKTTTFWTPSHLSPSYLTTAQTKQKRKDRNKNSGEVAIAARSSATLAPVPALNSSQGFLVGLNVYGPYPYGRSFPRKEEICSPPWGRNLLAEESRNRHNACIRSDRRWSRGLGNRIRVVMSLGCESGKKSTGPRLVANASWMSMQVREVRGRSEIVEEIQAGSRKCNSTGAYPARLRDARLRCVTVISARLRFEAGGPHVCRISISRMVHVSNRF